MVLVRAGAEPRPYQKIPLAAVAVSPLERPSGAGEGKDLWIEVVGRGLNATQ